MNTTEATLLQAIRARVASGDPRYTHGHLGTRYRHDCANLIQMVDDLEAENARLEREVAELIKALRRIKVETIFDAREIASAALAEIERLKGELKQR